MRRLRPTLDRMTAPTPDRLRQIALMIDAFDRDWYFDTGTKEIRRKYRDLRGRLLDVFWRSRHTVKAMYFWVNKNWSSETLIVYDFPLRHDNTPIKGFPMKFELQGGWTIPTSDLKYLTEGPLATEKTGDVLVPASSVVTQVLDAARKYGPVLTASSAVLGIVTNWKTASTAIQWIKNAV